MVIGVNTKFGIRSPLPYRTLRMKPLDSDASLRGSPSSVRRRRAIRRALGTGIVALAIASCGSDSTSDSAQSSTANPIVSIAPSTVVDTPPPTVALTTTAAPETTDAMPGSTIADPPATAAAGCRRLTDFDDGDGDGWAVVNDGVMGGRSNGAIEFADSAMRFTGDVVTAGGGFTSVRLQVTGDELTGTDYLTLRVRSDDRTYGLALQDTAQTGRRSISHRANLSIEGPADAAGWQTAALSFDELRPSVFGQLLDAAPFDPDQAVEFGIIIADGIDGPFELKVDWIDACSNQ